MKPHEKYKLVFEENFSGNTLNQKEWDYRVGERLGGLNRAENVAVHDGKLTIRFDYEPVDGVYRYTGGGILSKRLFGYGYYEAKAKLWGGTGGLHSSFWSMGCNGGDGVHTPAFNTIIEIDGYEVDSARPESIGSNVHYYVGAHRTVGGVLGAEDYPPVDSSKEAFVFGYEWLPNQINWYLNDVKIRTLPNPAFYGPQNVWLTALGCDAFDRNIDVTRLPGSSQWYYFRYYNIDLPGVNLVANGSFEYNKNRDFEKEYIRDLSIPVGWMVEGPDREASRVVETGEAYDGECALQHYSAQVYRVATKIEIPFLPEAMFQLEAMVRRQGEGRHLIQVAQGERVLCQEELPVTQEGIWQPFRLSGIRIPGGSCEVRICSEAPGGSRILVDAVSLVQTSGTSHTDLRRKPEGRKEQYLPLSDILIHPALADSGYQETGEHWGPSGLAGFLKSSRYAPADGTHCAIYRPRIERPGEYLVSFYKIVHPARAKRAKLTLRHRNGVEERWISHREGEPGFVELGWFELDGDSCLIYSGEESGMGDGEGDGAGTLAAETVRLETQEAQELREYLKRALVVRENANQVLNQGSLEKLDRQNSNVRARREQGILMVPIQALAIALGAGTFHRDPETGELSIFYADYMIRLRQGAEFMEVQNRKIPLRTPVRSCQGVLYMALLDLAESFGKTCYLYNETYGIVFLEKPPAPGRLQQLMPLFCGHDPFQGA